MGRFGQFSFLFIIPHTSNKHSMCLITPTCQAALHPAYTAMILTFIIVVGTTNGF